MDSNVNNIENKKNTKLIVMIIIILVVLVLGSFAVYKLVLSDDSEQSKESNNSSTVIDKENGGDVDTEADVEDETEPEVETEPDADNEKEDNKDKEFKFETAYGEVKIKATKALAGQGAAGASNTIFYIKYNNLYLYNHDGEDKLYATDVVDMYYETEIAEEITVKINSKTSIKIVDGIYLRYVNDKDKTFTFETAYGEVKIKATKALAGQGAAGASNTIFYIKYNNLYLYVHMDDDVLYATDVADIYYETEMSEQITVKLKSDSKIVEKSDYLDYVK